MAALQEGRGWIGWWGAARGKWLKGLGSGLKGWWGVAAGKWLKGLVGSCDRERTLMFHPGGGVARRKGLPSSA
eukprot:352399-Chlamydomonas_euryale.AAC.10